ncbi:30S ribosomal protein S18 [Frankia sp. QA3]|uniref:30S ribosomal protein S18 n=1 Tax=Frankia sp. QA3 TaxID=710111 RepID=UPI000269C932|nr:30S ribosomal protein S18 [Frankia sp. QA3]EIV94648.1 ribosomal protein S18 [Frankia sp. QA3]
MPTRRAPKPGQRKKPNILRERGITYVDYKDIALLRQFISDRGKIRARRITGLTPRQHREVTRAIKNAREMALLPYPGAAAARGR